MLTSPSAEADSGMAARAMAAVAASFIRIVVILSVALLKGERTPVIECDRQLKTTTILIANRE
ncbi:hypothetical protein MspRI1_20480 [Marinobacter sp. RI1]